MHDRHEPDSGFIDSLEGQVRAELRRRNRFAAAPRRGRTARPLVGLAVLVTASIIAGAAAMGASYQIEESWRRDLLLSALDMRLELARQRLQAAVEAHRRVEERVRLGISEPIQAASPELQVSFQQMQLRKLELQLLETQLSGREALDEISAPLVTGRDFVSERLQLEAEHAEHEVAVAGRSLTAVETRFRVGTADTAEVRNARGRVARAEVALESLGKRLEIRRRFLQEEITAEVAQLLALEAVAEEKLRSNQLWLEQMGQDAESARRRVELGVAPRSELVEASLRQLSYDVRVQEAQLELIIVRRQLEARGAR